ncbi:RNA-directed DNA polymerase, partial [Myxococcota bacterium]|nr:RNA-directed DNA polymerase [Myxococcota bacterium]
MTQPRTRQELYDIISQTSKAEFILEEMVRLGFWGDRPVDPGGAHKRRGEILKRLSALQSEAARTQNREAVLKAIRRERMAESRRKREENKQARIEAKRARAEAWRQRKAKEILYLGEGVSFDLSKTANNMDAWLGAEPEPEDYRERLEGLSASALPQLKSPPDLARALGISLGELRFLAFQRVVSSQSHYRQFRIAKKTGGLRTISAPMPRLKRVQRWILDEIINKIDDIGL